MVVLAQKHKLLWVGPGDIPENILSAIGGCWDISACDSPQPNPQQLDDAEVVLIAPTAGNPSQTKQLSEFLDRIDRSRSVAVVLLSGCPARENPISHRSGQFIIADADAPPGELAARIESARALQPVISGLRSDVAKARCFGSGAVCNSEEIEEEMRLAANLQRDFLPRSLPE
ncbi:MAG: hypothetical protein SVV80_13140, partial [Planctomycetota bacterium]|nr:hypothetical protein [Planctomycetota bacterium]